MNKLVKYIIESRFNFNIDLLDIEDNESGFSLSKQQYKSKSMKLEYEENSLFVDLGLPSGTKWCRYNLGCDFDLLASNPESTSHEDWYGKYYAWGELEENNYDWDTYKFEKNISISRCNFVKYCTKSKHGYKNFTDDLTELLPEDDVAYQTNSSWSIPSKELCQELIDHTDSKWISGENNDLYMNVRGLAGRLFISKINGNQLFIPAAGGNYETSLIGDGSYIRLWSSSLYTDEPYDAWYLSSDHRNVYMYHIKRYVGLNIRPVLK